MEPERNRSLVVDFAGAVEERELPAELLHGLFASIFARFGSSMPAHFDGHLLLVAHVLLEAEHLSAGSGRRRPGSARRRRWAR
jgi:hypothetical protein